MTAIAHPKQLSQQIPIWPSTHSSVNCCQCWICSWMQSAAEISIINIFLKFINIIFFKFMFKLIKILNFLKKFLTKIF